MTEARGFKSRLLLDFESTYNQDPAVPAAYALPVDSIGLQADRNKRTPPTLRGYRSPARPRDGNLDVSGPLAVPLDYTAFWYWLKAMFGAPSTSGAGPYDHTFTVPDLMPSLVLERQYQDIAKYWKYNGCKVNTWTQRFGGDDDLVASLDIIGANETPGTVPYDAAPTEVSYDPFQMYQVALEEGGTALAICSALDFTLNFNLDTDKYLIGGQGQRGRLPEGMIEATGNLTALFEDHTLVQKALNSTESSLHIEIISGVNELDLMFNEIQFGRAKAPVEGPQGIMLTVPWVAYYDDHADQSALVATLTNGDEHA